jgi:hypothetical protein
LILGFVVLVAAVLLQLGGKNSPPAYAARSGRLATMLPPSLDGWLVRDEPIGETESLRQRTEQVLSYDDYVFRSYRAVGNDFSIYMVHWAKGRMPTRLIALHTPDRCWTENGWTCEEARFNERVEGTRAALPAAQSRIFVSPEKSARVYVRFWLMADGKLYDFGERLNRMPAALRWIHQAACERFTENGEHLFVRITSSQSFESLERNSGYQAVMKKVSEILNETATPSSSQARRGAG